jgi:flagellar hook-length control protein FliK
VSDATGASAPADLTPGDGAPSNPADGGSVAPDALPPTEESAPQPAADGVVRPVGNADSSAPAGAASPPADDGPVDPGALPPTEESAPQPAADGVVRPVGNAESFASAGPQPSPADRNARPLPRAAEPAILHAAPNSAVGQLRDAAPAPDAAPPRPADPPAPQAIQNLDAVATAVIERVEAGGGEARIHLEPAGLGEITIRLHARHDAVHVDVHAETPEAVQLLRDAAADLSSLLGQRGMNLAGLDIGLGARQGGDSGSSSAGTRARPTAAPGEFAALLGIEDPAAVAREHRLRAAYNPDGSLLYRV